MNRTDAQIAALALATLDLTDLGEDTTTENVAALCERAARHRPAAVCVWPRFVAQCATALAGTGVRVATVVNFPSGDEPAGVVGAMAAQAIADGADEIDVVLPYRAFLADDPDLAAAALDATQAATGDATVKVIIESGELGDAATIKDAARFAVEHGANFVKTSTGKTPVSATPEAARAILEVLASLGTTVGPVGFKASGGVRTVADARVYLDMAEEIMGAGWVTPETFRFGASGLLGDILCVLGDDDGAAADGGNGASY